MSFQDDIQATPGVQDAWRPGLGAMRHIERQQIAPQDPQRLRGSADVDTALTATLPNANRWDYAVAYEHTHPAGERVYWIEVHSAHDHGATEVLLKLQWLQDWLNGAGSRLRRPNNRFVWIASGKIAVTRDSRRVRQLATRGVDFPVRILNIADRLS